MVIQFQRQSAEGLSLTFVNLWLAGDFFNIIGAVLQGVLPTMIILAVYYTVADIVLLIQCLVYNNRNSKQVDYTHLNPATPLLDEEYHYHHHHHHHQHQHQNENYGTQTYEQQEEQDEEADEPLPRWKEALYNFLIISCVILSGIIGWWFSSSNEKHHRSGGDNDDDKYKLDFWGQIFGWLCAVFYLGSRVPQILLNYERKSCEGVSFLFFVFACLGNLTYVISILVKDQSKAYLILNASWLAGSIGTLIEDFIIFIQFWIYNQPGAS